MSEQRIITPETAANITAWTTQLKAMATTFKAKSYNIEKKKKAGVRTMAEGREGLARLVSSVATEHVDSLSRSDNPADLAAKLAYDTNLETLRQSCMRFMEMIEDTQWANSADIMLLVDRFVQVLQAQRGSNTALDNALSEIDNFNKQFGPLNTDTDTAPAPTPPSE
jgi:hypothetical protein